MSDVDVLVVPAIPSHQWLREVCSYRLLYHEDLNIVEIDESCFSHKPKINAYCSHVYIFELPTKRIHEPETQPIFLYNGINTLYSLLVIHH